VAISEKEIETIVVRCDRCGQPVKAIVEGTFNTDRYSGAAELQEFLLLKCNTCHAPMLAAREVEWGLDGWSPGSPLLLYPQPNKSLSASVPETIRDAYDEAVSCYSGGSYTASALMVRRALQALVTEKLQKKTDISPGLQKLRDAGELDPEFYKWADELRLVGNSAAHDVADKISKQIAKDQLDFAHALIEYLFTFKQKFVEFQERRKKGGEAKLRPPIPYTEGTRQ
jgi:hypothetical protein